MSGRDGLLRIAALFDGGAETSQNFTYLDRLNVQFLESMGSEIAAVERNIELGSDFSAGTLRDSEEAMELRRRSSLKSLGYIGHDGHRRPSYLIYEGRSPWQNPRQPSPCRCWT